MTYTGRDITVMREALGVSGVDMASLLCVHPVTIYHWANHRSKMGLVGFPLLVVQTWKESKLSRAEMKDLGLRLGGCLVRVDRAAAVSCLLQALMVGSIK